MFNKILKFAGFRSPTAATPSEPATDHRPAPLEVTDADFAELVLYSDKLTVVDFWAEWCQPCAIISAYINFLAADCAGRIVVAALDVDANPQTPATYGIQGLPTVIFFHQGQEMDRVLGVVSYPELRQRVEALLARLNN
jgi:thioredoxin 1